jgi:outer membrane protein OmpA-like peptidoglycan-associated protein
VVLLVGALVALAVALSPQAPSEEVVLLPGPDGKVGMVVVERQGGVRHVLEKAYDASRSGSSEVGRGEPDSVRAAFGPALAALPSRPTSFLLYFESGTDNLTQASRGELDKMLAEMRRRSIPDVRVIAHTDTVGDVASNDALSAQRAERVKSFLVGIGIAEGRIHTAGRGERELLVPTADEVDEPRNRRVEISVR